MSGVVDGHIHLWPEEVGADPVGWARARGEARFAALFDRKTATGRSGAEEAEWPTVAAARAAMGAAGVSAAVVQGWYWERWETCVEHMEWLAKAVGAAGDPDGAARLAWCAPFHAGGGAEAVVRVRRAVEEEGAVGIGELFPPAQGYAWDDPWLAELLRWAMEATVPVVLHVTEPVGPDWAGRVETPLGEVVALARRHPGLRLVLAHWGGGLPWYLASPPVDRALATASYDTAAAPRLGRTQPAWAAALATAGAGRLVWASDYPLRLYRGRDAAVGWRHWREQSEAALSGLTPEARAAVLGGNAHRLFFERGG